MKTVRFYFDANVSYSGYIEREVDDAVSETDVEDTVSSDDIAKALSEDLGCCIYPENISSWYIWNTESDENDENDEETPND